MGEVILKNVHLQKNVAKLQFFRKFIQKVITLRY